MGSLQQKALEHVQIALQQALLFIPLPQRLLHYRGFLMPPKVSGPTTTVMNCPWVFDALPSLAPYTIRMASAGCIQNSSGNRGSHRSWACDPPYPAAHYALGHGSSSPKAQHKLLRPSCKNRNGTYGIELNRGPLVSSTCRRQWSPLSSVPCQKPWCWMRSPLGYLGSPWNRVNK